MICEALSKLATQSGLVASVVGTILSIVLELWSGWADWKNRRKSVFVLCLGLPIVALLIGVFGPACAGMAFTVDTLAAALVVGVEAFIAATAMYKLFVNKYIATRDS